MKSTTRYLLNILTLLLLSIFLFSCDGYNKVLKSSDLNLKYDKALEYYNNEEYYKAYPLLEELLTIYRGTSKGEQLYYYYAMTEYQLGDVSTASYRFKRFTDTYSTSQYAEECMFLSAYCYYLQSPDYSLDQEKTHEAIENLQLFMNRYPESSKRDSCNKLVDILQHKLEKKSYKTAYQYLHMEEYKAAIIAFENMLQDYPDNQYLEDIYFHILQARYLLAKQSIEIKKAERIDEAIKSYITFVDSFSGSKMLRQAESYYAALTEEREKLKNKNVQ